MEEEVEMNSVETSAALEEHLMTCNSTNDPELRKFDQTQNQLQEQQQLNENKLTNEIMDDGSGFNALDNQQNIDFNDEHPKQLSNESSDDDHQEQSNDSNEVKHSVEQEDVKMEKEEQSDNVNKKQQDIVQDFPLNEDEEMNAGKDDENDKEKSAQGQDNFEESQLGRNRRVRQKNRYFLDFHCIDLTKGARGANKDEYEAFTTSTSTRSSNRRSTTDSNRSQQEKPIGIEERYCRKCSDTTVHDVDGGCQICLYKKIIESSKRQRPSGQRSRSGTSRQQQKQQQQQQNDTENETETNNTVTTSKRKATKQGGSAKGNGNSNGGSSSSNSNSSSNINNNINIIIRDNKIVRDTTSSATTNTTKSVSTDSEVDIKVDNPNNNIANCGNNKLPNLDSWTPDEVAEYILSKGFATEAELFKSQSVDGISLLLMQRTDFTYGLKIKLGPALKIYDQVCRLKKEYFRNVATSN